MGVAQAEALRSQSPNSATLASVSPLVRLGCSQALLPTSA